MQNSEVRWIIISSVKSLTLRGKLMLILRVNDGPVIQRLVYLLFRVTDPTCRCKLDLSLSVKVDLNQA